MSVLFGFDVSDVFYGFPGNIILNNLLADSKMKHSN